MKTSNKYICIRIDVEIVWRILHLKLVLFMNIEKQVREIITKLKKKDKNSNN